MANFPGAGTSRFHFLRKSPVHGSDNHSWCEMGLLLTESKLKFLCSFSFGRFVLRTVLCSCRGWQCGTILKLREPLLLQQPPGFGGQTCIVLRCPSPGPGLAVLAEPCKKAWPRWGACSRICKSPLKIYIYIVFKERLAKAGCVGIFITRDGHSHPRKISAALVTKESAFPVELVGRRVLLTR